MLVISLARGASIAFALALVLTASAASTASGQVSDRGRITGRVTDSTGGVLPGTQVTLSAENMRRIVVTNEQGFFAFDGVAPGAAHTIQAQLPGFMTTTREGLVVAPGETRTVDLTLQLGCPGRTIAQYGVAPALDQLLTADAVAYIRIAQDSREVQIDLGGECPHYYDHGRATVLEVATSLLGEWRRGMTIELYSDVFFRAGAEYLAFLTYSESPKGYGFGRGALAITVIEGRVEWSPGAEFGFRDGAPVARALAGFRETYARHTRYRPLGKEGSEAPLGALRNKTGWFLMGGIQASGERWVDLYSEPETPIGRPFDFVNEPESSRQLPRRGDRIRLTKGGAISIVNFGFRGEALRDRPPTQENTYSSPTNVTGTRVDAGGLYDVADLVLEPVGGTIRFVWVRLVAIQNNR
jgi:hypothetical protein